MQVSHGVLSTRSVLLRHSSPPHGEEFDAEVELSGLDHAHEGAEVAARVLDPALPAVLGGIVLIELQNVDHCDRGSDGTVPLIGPRVLADGDAFGSLGVNRRDALWTIKGLSDEVMPLFAAADERDRVIRSEAQEPAVALTPMT